LGNVRRAPTGRDEIEVTQEMREADELILAGFAPGYASLGDVYEEIYRAMARLVSV
jgi:hypothetical protein